MPVMLTMVIAVNVDNGDRGNLWMVLTTVTYAITTTMYYRYTGAGPVMLTMVIDNDNDCDNDDVESVCFFVFAVPMLMRESLKSSVHKRQITAVLELTAGRLHTTRAWPVHAAYTLQGPGPYKLHTPGCLGHTSTDPV